MPLSKAQKTKILGELKDKVGRQKAIAFGDIAGVKVVDLMKLRQKMREAGGEIKVAKKTLISRVLKEQKIDVDLKKMGGEIALGFSYQDEIAPFRIFHLFTKENENLKLLGGIISGGIFDREKALTLAQLPSRQELLAKMVGSISSPLAGMVRVLQGNLRNLVYVLSEIQKIKS